MFSFLLVLFIYIHLFIYLYINLFVCLFVDWAYTRLHNICMYVLECIRVYMGRWERAGGRTGGRLS